jgi:hypothetical protein
VGHLFFNALAHRQSGNDGKTEAALLIPAAAQDPSIQVADGDHCCDNVTV